MTQPQVQFRREEILDAALALFEQGGLEAVSFRRIASQLNCSYAAPYGYFGSKQELIVALRARTFRWMESRMTDAIRECSSPLDQLRRLARAYMAAAIDEADRYALMFFDRGGHDAATSPELVEAKRAALDVCTRVVMAAEKSGQLALRVDPLSAAHLFWCGAHGLVSLQVAEQFVMGRTFEGMAPMMIDTLIAGLMHAPSPALPP